MFRFLVTNILHHEPICNDDGHYPENLWQAADTAAGILEATMMATQDGEILDETTRWSMKGRLNSKALQDAFFWIMECRFKEGKMKDLLTDNLGPTFRYYTWNEMDGGYPYTIQKKSNNLGNPPE